MKVWFEMGCRTLVGLGLVVAFVTVFQPARVQAQFFGAPTPKLKKGQVGVGVALAPFRRKFRAAGAVGQGTADFSRETVFVEYGLFDSGSLRGEYSTTDLGDFRGDEFSVGYKGVIGKSSRRSGMRLDKGFFAIYRTASVSADGVTDPIGYNQIDAGAGATFFPIDQVGIFGGGVFSRFDGSAGGADIEADSSLGLYFGGFFDLDPSIRLGGQFNLLFETGFALYGRLDF